MKIRNTIALAAVSLTVACGVETKLNETSPRTPAVDAPDDGLDTVTPGQWNDVEFVYLDHVQPGEFVPEEVAVVPGSRRVDLRLRGVDGELAVRVRQVQVLVDGAAVPVDREKGELVLGRIDEALRVGSFELAPDATHVEFVVALEDSARSVLADSSREVDASGIPMFFDTSAANLAARGKAVIDLDVRRSIFEHDDVAMLLPHFDVRY